jgi:hypothetical protein
MTVDISMHLDHDILEQDVILKMRTTPALEGGELADYGEALRDHPSAKDAAKQLHDASTSMRNIIFADAPWLKERITPRYARLLPGRLRRMVTVSGSKGWFVYGP